MERDGAKAEAKPVVSREGPESMLHRYTGDTAEPRALRDALGSMFQGVARDCRDERQNVVAAVAQAFAAIEAAMIQVARASRLALLRLAEARAAGSDAEVERAIEMLEALDGMLLDAAEEAADHSERPVQRELLKHVLVGRTRGTPLRVIAASARRDVAALRAPGRNPIGL